MQITQCSQRVERERGLQDANNSVLPKGCALGFQSGQKQNKSVSQRILQTFVFSQRGLPLLRGSSEEASHSERPFGPLTIPTEFCPHQSLRWGGALRNSSRPVTLWQRNVVLGGTDQCSDCFISWRHVQKRHVPLTESLSRTGTVSKGFPRTQERFRRASLRDFLTDLLFLAESVLLSQLCYIVWRDNSLRIDCSQRAVLLVAQNVQKRPVTHKFFGSPKGLGYILSQISPDKWWFTERFLQTNDCSSRVVFGFGRGAWSVEASHSRIIDQQGLQ